MPRLIGVFAGHSHVVGFVMRQLRLLKFQDIEKNHKNNATGIQEVAVSILGSSHISFIEIWSLNNFYGHSLTTTDSNRAVVSYWQKYGHLVLVNRLGSLPRNSVDRITDYT